MHAQGASRGTEVGLKGNDFAPLRGVWGGGEGGSARKMGVDDLTYMAQTHLSYHIFGITICKKKFYLFIYCVFRMLKKTAEKLK